jgi:uncharacterized membrane protein (Fun14 family)
VESWETHEERRMITLLAMFAVASMNSEIDAIISEDDMSPTALKMAFITLALLFDAVPFVLGFYLGFNA